MARTATAAGSCKDARAWSLSAITVAVLITVTPVARLVRDEVASGGVAAEGPFRLGGQS
jgi:hypothetical protein